MCTLAPGDPALGGARCFVVTCRSKMSPPSVDAGEAGVLRTLELGDALPENCYVVRRESRDPGLSLPADRRGRKGLPALIGLAARDVLLRVMGRIGVRPAKFLETRSSWLAVLPVSGCCR
jgi:hypothetical protein